MRSVIYAFVGSWCGIGLLELKEALRQFSNLNKHFKNVINFPSFLFNF